MKFLDDEHLRQLSGKRWEEIPEFIMGEKFDEEQRKDIALSIRYIAERLRGKTGVRQTSKLQYVNNEWIYR